MLVGSVVEELRFLIWIGLALLVVWVVTVFLVNLGILKPRSTSVPGEGGGAAESSTDEPGR